MTNIAQPIYHTYKDRVFRLLFKDKQKLLMLYNALNDTDYTNEDDLTINTLENAIFLKMKNDISFIVDCNMCLYEHQSSYCPNMPLRGYLYFADLFKIHIKDADLSVSKRILIPTPQYIVFYNGNEKKEEEFVQKLSDSFENGKEGCMELAVRTININYGHNQKLMEKCRPLAEYAYFIKEIRKNLETMSLQNAVVCAIDTCISRNILKDFLIQQKAEVIAMSIYEYNEEYVKKTLYEDGYESGYDSGKNDGATSEHRKMLVSNVETIMQNFHLDLASACQGLNISVQEYEEAKANDPAGISHPTGPSI